MPGVGLLIMKRLMLSTPFLIFVAIAHGQPQYRHTDSYPKLHVKTVSIPANRSRPLKITLAVTCVGRTPIALSRDQFSVSISTENDPYLFYGEAIFAAGTPRILRLNSDETILLTVRTVRDRNFPQKSWGRLRPGNYELRVYINSGKSAEFDYQWLGQTYSNDYLLRIR